MHIGNVNVDFEGLMISGPAGEHFVESKIMDVLQVLTDKAGQVVLREDLIDAVWGVGYGGDERLSRAISLLRKSLGDSRGNHQYIQTIPRKGYKLIAELHDAADSGTVPVEPAMTVSLTKPDTIAKTDIADSKAITLDVAVTDIGISIAPAKRRDLAKVLVLVALLLFGVISFALVQLSPFATKTYRYQSVEHGLEKVLNFTQKNAIAEAQQTFSVILANNPEHAAARAGMALALIREYTHLERDPALLRRAKSAAEAAYRIDNNLALANIAVAWAAEFEGDYDRAQIFYDRTDILDPDNILALEGRVRTYSKQENSKAAKGVLEQAISLHPDHAVFYSISGQLLLRDDNYELAESQFRHAISLFKGNARAYAQLAHTLHAQNKTKEAIKVLQDGLEINESAILYNNLGTYLYFQGQYQMAAQAFERTLELSGDTHQYLYWANIADAYRFVPSKVKDAASAYDRAIQLIESKFEIEPDSLTLKSRLALYHAKRGNLDRAAEVIGNIQLKPDTPSVVLYRALVTFEILSDRDQALAMLEKALKAGYPLIEIKNDPELAALRQDTNYHLLLIKQGP